MLPVAVKRGAWIRDQNRRREYWIPVLPSVDRDDKNHLL